MSICLIDTGVFCNIIPVPGRDQQREEMKNKLDNHLSHGVTLLLPMASIIETGNHIAHCPDGRRRWEAAGRFVNAVQAALEGKAPWKLTSVEIFSPREFSRWLGGFPDEAMRGLGIGDVSIIEEFRRQCRLHPDRRIFIWSLDHHLTAYASGPGSDVPL